MSSLTNKETEILLVLVKEFSVDYNPHTISKMVKMSHAGAFKAMKELERKGFIRGKKIGRANFYKLNLEDYYVFRTIETLLINEAREKAQRWLFEFKELAEHSEILVIFGSTLKNANAAKDIDILIVLKNKEYDEVMRLIKEKNKILLKPIHPVVQTPNDLENNLKAKQEVVLDILKTGYVLHGCDKLLEVVKNVSSR
ncbi:nucleotidyltransferase domain-containing protein [Candidatus Woesearchaeota archaeon]|nr:nucleotidyltransferase domain-containing protein [Candidatus Woesearchaeota archaeon]